MYENAKPQIDAILKLVDGCPEPLKQSCFEILLKGYVGSLAPAPQVIPASPTAPLPPSPPLGTQSPAVPEAIKTRLDSLAKRLSVTPSALSALFDFTVDPFVYHGLAVPGKNTAEKTRSVALLIGAKSYLTLGKWRADWAEFKAMCVDQNCYDRKNTAQSLQHENFTSAESESGIVLSSTGTKSAEQLLAKLAGKPDAE